MKRIIFLSVVLSVLTSSVFSQGINRTFLLGYDVLLFDTNVTSTKGRMLFDSASVNVIPETRKMPIFGSQSTISDINGNLIISTNGCWIADATGDTMQNGGGLNPNSFTNAWCDNTSGIPFSSSNVILPMPGDSLKYVLLHQTGNYSQTK